MNDYIIYGVGLLAQMLFASRMLIQWIKSEQAKSVLSPSIFWQLSIVASFLMIIYGVLRNDLIIIGGQCISYFIYIRNLQFKGAWDRLSILFKAIVVVFPLLAIIWLAYGHIYNLEYILSNSEISMPLFTWGALAQIIFTSRFVYQWFFSEKSKESVLPVGFWIISLIGSMMVIVYAIMRLDPIYTLGQLLPIIVYVRNLIIHRNAMRK